MRPKTHSAHPALTFGNWPLSFSGQEVGRKTWSLFHLLRPRWTLGVAAPPPGVQRGCPECTGPNHSVRPALVHSALTCCRVLGSLASSSPIANPSSVPWEPLTGRHPAGESCMPSEKEEKPVGQGSSMECPRPLCSPRTPSSTCRGLSPLQYVSLWLMLTMEGVEVRKCCSYKPRELQN